MLISIERFRHWSIPRSVVCIEREPPYFAAKHATASRGKLGVQSFGSSQ